MKLHEVLQEPEVLSGKKWLRPVGFPRGFWYVVKGGTCYNGHGVPGLHRDAAILAGEWEAVAPKDCMKK